MAAWMPRDRSSQAGANPRFDALEVLREINIAIARGEFISLVGPSGCGKTTLLRIVAGLEAASAGEVRLDGRAVREPGSDRGFVFQSDSLLPWRTVFANEIDEAVFLSDRALVLARRPGRVQEDVAITLPRPRSLAIKRTPEFVAYVDHIWRLIEDDVRASVIEEHA
jgi:ABC-type nitrate/sulfonate/bicarbonate transport system ATPase subunit